MTGGHKRAVAAIGECMLELSDPDGGPPALGFGGDTLNMAVYLARLAGDALRVSYVTALGDDPYSARMLAAWQDEGIDVGLVARLPGRLPGLYAIRTDAEGERSFCYWRSAAAARELLSAAEARPLVERAMGCDVLYLSGITLSILDAASRERLLDMVAAARGRGATMAFDSNYRPRGWPDRDAARAAMAAALRLADLALPSLDDERALWGDDDVEAVLRRHRDLGVREVVVKDGAGPVRILADGARLEVAPAAAARPVDTTAAGDSFNAAYLRFRLAGAAPDTAARAGARLAATVIGHRGAIVPRAAMPSFDDLLPS